MEFTTSPTHLRNVLDVAGFFLCFFFFFLNWTCTTLCASCRLLTEGFSASEMYLLLSLILSPSIGYCGRRNKVLRWEPRGTKGSCLNTWSRSEHSHACFAYCQKCSAFYCFPSRSIQLHSLLFFHPPQTLPLLTLGVANARSCVDPHSKLDHSARHQRRLTGSSVGSQRNINRLQNVFFPSRLDVHNWIREGWQWFQEGLLTFLDELRIHICGVTAAAANGVRFRMR